MKLQKKAAVVSSLIGSLLMAVTLTAAEGDPVIEPRAAEVLRSMGTYMNGLSQFTFSATNTHDFVMTGNQKITMFARSNVSVKRPNRVRSDRVGEVVDLQFFDDGSALTLYGPGDNFYAQREFDQNLHAVFDHLRDELGLEVPAGDLLYADPAEEMLAAAESGTYVGLADVGGVMCHHLAFRTPDVDWQIWIETGDRPLPRRYSLFSKWVASAPESTVEIHDWNVSASLPNSMFQFRPPNGAKRIVFADLSEGEEDAEEAAR